jgi:hypothetical protein
MMRIRLNELKRVIRAEICQSLVEAYTDHTDTPYEVLIDEVVTAYMKHLTNNIDDVTSRPKGKRASVMDYYMLDLYVERAGSTDVNVIARAIVDGSLTFQSGTATWFALNETNIFNRESYRMYPSARSMFKRRVKQRIKEKHYDDMVQYAVEKLSQPHVMQHISTL